MATSRRGFTLVELLVVIVILGILSAIVVGALRGAQQDTLVAKTRATIAKIDAVINERYDEYLGKPLSFIATPANQFPPPPVRFVDRFPTDTFRPGRPMTPLTVFRRPDTNWATGVAPAGLLRERVRIAATRDLMRMEMPDRIGDLCTGTVSTPGGDRLVAKPPAILATGFQTAGGATQLWMQLEIPHEFSRIINRINRSNHLVDNLYLNEELLYLIVEGSYVDGAPAVEAFASSEIGDVDGDGLPEFLDAWGRPIRWLRWPAGYPSVVPLNPDPLDPTLLTSGGAATDPYDPTNADVGFDYNNLTSASIPVFRSGDGLRPLVVSAGPDGRFGLRFHWRQDYMLPAASAFNRAPLFSPSNVQYPLNFPSPNTPNGPGYFPTGFNWPDPYHPRVDLSLYNPRDYRLGGILSCAVDRINLDGEIIGARPQAGGSFLFDAVPLGTVAAIDNALRTQAQDNVTNLDESGASL